MQKKYILYYHRNKINGKLYIGISSNTFKYRCGSNGNGYAHCPKFHNAIQKYGWNNFEHTVLLENLNKEVAEICQQYLIKKYHTKEDGYNIESGGNLGKELSSETKQKIRQARLNTSESEAHKQKILLGSPTRQEIRLIETNEIFPSIRSAERKYHIDHRTICDNLKQKQSCGGTLPDGRKAHWEYLDSTLNPTQKKKYAHGAYFQVQCIETGEIFQTAEKAAKVYNLKHGSGIMKCCKGLSKTSAGMHWRFYQKTN